MADMNSTSHDTEPNEHEHPLGGCSFVRSWFEVNKPNIPNNVRRVRGVRHPSSDGNT
jgi:hypothetical protein